MATRPKSIVPIIGESDIDEWQDAPQFWDAIRFDVDHSEGFGHYILTGSSVPLDASAVAFP